MARRKQQDAEGPIRHPLLVYYNLGKRYRPPALLLVFIGLLSFLPSFINELENDFVEPGALAAAGVVIVLVGVAFWLFSLLAKRRAYVQCLPDVLLIRTPFYKVPISYRRLKMAQPVQVSQVFPRESLKGMGKPLMKPLLAMTAVELHMKSWPTSKKRLKRFMSHYLFSPRSEAWILIVPNYGMLIRQIDAASHRKMETDQGRASSYEDPIERLTRY